MKVKEPIFSQQPPDRQARLDGATRLDRNVLVLAGAGTGKTRLLIDRLLFLILGKGIPVEQIVALTFTKKAAEEMRVRLEEELRKMAEDPTGLSILRKYYPELQDQWPLLIQKVLVDIPKAQIGTIHSFAAFLLRLYPLHAGVDPRFREDEGEVFDQIFEEEWHAWLSKEMREKAPRSRLWLEILSEVPVCDLKDLARAFGSPLNDLEALKCTTDLTPWIQRRWEELMNLEKKYAPPESEKFSNFLAAMKRILKAALGKQTPQEEDRVVLEENDLRDPPKEWKLAKEELRRLRQQTLALGNVDDSLIQKVMNLLLPFIKKVRYELARQGAVSFEGLLVSARNLLRNSPEVRQELKRRFHSFLIDEFQDTDPLQGEILFYLAEKEELLANDWKEVKLGAGRLFVVGDPKQSIYRFRGADMAAFEEFQNRMESQGALVVDLQANYRSQAAILEAVNALFKGNMISEPYVQPPYAALMPMKNGHGENPVEIMFITAKEDKGGSASDLRWNEAHAIADWIEKNVGSDLNGRPLEYRDCALLFRSANAFDEYLEVFKSRGIPYLSEGEKFFYHTYEVTEFLNLLSALADPEDKLSLVGVLRSPLGGLTDEEIWQCAQKGGLDYRSAPALASLNLQRLYALLKPLSLHAQWMPVPQLIQEIFERTWILEYMSQSRFGEQAVANLLKIKALAEKWTENHPMSLKEFVKRFNTYREDEKEEGENPLADVNVDAVKIMTIHKAKGLEFPVVFLPNLCAAKKRGFIKPVVLRDWRSGEVGLRLRKTKKTNSAMLMLEERSEQHNLAEEVRVFYVASTRAQNKLVFILREKTSDTVEARQYFQNIVAWPDKSMVALNIKGLTIPVSQIEEKGKFLLNQRSFKKEKLDPRWNVGELSNRIQKRLANRKALRHISIITSPTEQMRKEWQAPRHKEKQDLIQFEYEKERVRDEDEELPQNTAIQVGLLCHGVLEEWDFRLSALKGIPVLKSKLITKGRGLGLVESVGNAQPVFQEAQAILEAFFNSAVYEDLQRVKILGREIPFLGPYHNQGKEVPAPFLMRGVIDLLYEREGKLFIADYKTNKVDEKDLKSTLSHYKIQAESYTVAIERAIGKKAQFELIFLRIGRSVRVG